MLSTRLNALTLPAARKFDLPLERRSHPRTTIVVDAACDLPDWYVRANNIVVLPMRILGKDLEVLDNRSPERTRDFFSQKLISGEGRFSVRAMSPVETQRFLLENVEANRDNLLQLTSSSGSSMVYHVSTQIARGIMMLHRRARKQTHYRTKFRMWVMDSRTMFTGEGIMASAAVGCLARGDAPKRIVEQLRVVRRSVHTLVLPTEPALLPPIQSNHDESLLTQMVKRLREPAQRVAVLHTYVGDTRTLAIGRDYKEASRMLFEAVDAAITRGLDLPTVIVSYAGALEDIESRTDYQALIERGRAKRIEIMLAPMSMVGAANLGAHAITIGFASKRFLI